MARYFFFVIIWASLGFQHLWSADCNRRLLEMHADDLAEKLWRHASITEEDIQSKLDFMTSSQTSTPSETSFEAILEKSHPLQNDPSFLIFASTYQHLYESSQDEEAKIALCLLLNSVIKKHSKSQRLRQRIKDFSQKDVQREVNQAPRFIGTADRSPPLMTSPSFSSEVF